VCPPRALCPSCGGRRWSTANAASGTIEELTRRKGVVIASVRTDLGPLVIARVEADLAPGDTCELDGHDGIPVAR
jgi:hypothetical protein